MVWDVESAEWVRGLSDDAILAATDEGSFQRGLDYAARGMVQQVATLNRGRVVVAKVAGSERGTYQTIVSLHSDPGDAVVEWGARCSCPVARDCKHAVAVVVSVRDALGGSAGGVEPPPPTRPWEDALALLTRDPDPDATLSAEVIRAQLRSIVVDLLQVLGQEGFGAFAAPSVVEAEVRRDLARLNHPPANWPLGIPAADGTPVLDVLADATNVIAAPRLTVITPVSIDHTQYLGDTLAKIAAEKAGILKRGVNPVGATLELLIEPIEDIA